MVSACVVESFVITAVEFSMLKWCSSMVKFTMLWSSHMINHLVVLVVVVAAVLKSIWMLFKIGVTAQEPAEWGGDVASSGGAIVVGTNSCDRKILGGNGGGGCTDDGDDDGGNIVSAGGGGGGINKVAFKANANGNMLFSF